MTVEVLKYVLCLVVVADVNEVLSVDVREEDMKYGNVGYVVVLNFESGYSIGVTEVATTDDRRYDSMLQEDTVLVHGFFHRTHGNW